VGAGSSGMAFVRKLWPEVWLGWLLGSLDGEVFISKISSKDEIILGKDIQQNNAKHINK
jgi:hypothetical protein